jgi:DNA-binding transcriptional LysR family regulator
MTTLSTLKGLDQLSPSNVPWLAQPNPAVIMDFKMELRHLRYFVAVAEALNFTKAATRLRVAQPALSRQVSDLEEELGVDLLQRTSHGVRLTAEGKVFLEDAQEILKRAAESVTKVRALARGEIGELQVGYLPPLDLYILPRALAEFQKTTPGVRVVLHDLGTDELVNELRNGTLDLALMMQPTDEATTGMEFEEIGRYPFFVAMASAHPLARMKTISVETLAKQPLVVLARRRNSEYHRTLQRLFAPLRPNIATESDSMNSLITELNVGKCVAVVSEVFRQAVGKRLLYRRLVNTEVAMCVGIARAKNGDLPPAAEKFCTTIRTVAKT